MSFVQESLIRSFSKTIFVCVISVACMQAQTEDTHPDEGISNLFAEAFAFASDQPGKGRVDIYVQVPYPEINFVKEGDRYTGRLEISATILTREKQQIWQNSQLTELYVKDFSQTVSHRFSSLKQFSADIAPGNYELLLQITDQESKKIESIKRSITVKDFGNDTLAVSSVMMVSRISLDGMRKTLIPNLTGMITKEQSSFYLFFEVYNRVPIDSVKLICTLVNPKQEVVAQRTKSELLTDSRTQVIWQLDTLSISPERYALLVDAVGIPKSDAAKSFRASVSRSCIVRMKNMPLMITDIDKAIDELLYIAKGGDIDDIRDAKTPEEKQKRFLEFWAKHNPNPKEPNNELMEEYYSRVEYANKTFGTHMDGWKTDRGMVLIQFGPPQNIERHPFDADNKPYEIWYYYEQNREFIFVDETGFGDYRLRYPETDLWGRIR